MMLDLAQNSPPIRSKIPTLTTNIVEKNKTCTEYMFFFKEDPSQYKTHPYSILQVPTTQLAKMSTDPKVVKLTDDIFHKIYTRTYIFETTEYNPSHKNSPTWYITGTNNTACKYEF